MDNAGLARLQKLEEEARNGDSSKEAKAVMLAAIEKARPLMEFGREEREAKFNDGADYMAEVMPVTAAIVESLLFGHEEGYQFRYMPTV